MINNVSFKSKINFVNRQTFLKTLPENSKFINFTLESPLCEKGQDFYTTGVKTCSAGGLTDTKIGAAGFHLLDDIQNYYRIEGIWELIFKSLPVKPSNALLIGSKDQMGRPYSLKMFRKIKKILSEKVPNVSVFETHAKTMGATDCQYDLKTDTWTICTGFLDSKNKYSEVSCVDDLRKNFKNITLSKRDTLFINGEEVIL
ncbi:hypothetical protein IKQ21_07325 [bacterium]|nr:hypothetical protein [bacterium]